MCCEAVLKWPRSKLKAVYVYYLAMIQPLRRATLPSLCVGFDYDDVTDACKVAAVSSDDILFLFLTKRSPSFSSAYKGVDHTCCLDKGQLSWRRQ